MTDSNAAVISEFFRKAADAIGQYGHQKKTYGDTDRGFCLTGACSYVAGLEGLQWHRASAFSPQFRHLLSLAGWKEAMDILVAECMERYGTSCLVPWNDRPETRREDVIDLLLGAAKRAEEDRSDGTQVLSRV